MPYTAFFELGPQHSFESAFPNAGSMEYTTPLNGETCVHDYANQLCPFNWDVGWDGDSCVASDEYHGPCEPVWYHMSQMSAADKRIIAEKCRARWLCVNEMSEHGEVPFLSKGLEGTASGVQELHPITLRINSENSGPVDSLKGILSGSTLKGFKAGRNEQWFRNTKPAWF
eukprot:GEMP01053762.1.p1 GENE.GEMP01053762.1~~GEMP01053762.1.p1  ORF type:complete len:171 (+),score=20.77 GEMP01053762.1:311-823(+)